MLYSICYTIQQTDNVEVVKTSQAAAVEKRRKQKRMQSTNNKNHGWKISKQKCT